MLYLTEAGVKFLNEYDDLKGKLDRKTSPLTPQGDALHNLKAKPSKLRAAWGAAKEFVGNARDIKRKIDASPKGSRVHYSKEGGVDTKLEKLTGLYAKLRGRKFSSASLEDPKYDPDVKGNRGERLAARTMEREGAKRMKRIEARRPGTIKGDLDDDENRIATAAKKYGEKIARKGKEYAFSGDPKKQKSHIAYAQEDHGRKKPTSYERAQRTFNRVRRRGFGTNVGDHQAMGMTVVGPVGGSHVKEARGDALLKGLGEPSARSMGQRLVGSKSVEGQIRQIGEKPWKGARSLPAHTRTKAKSRKRVSDILSLYKFGTRVRALPKSSVEPHVKAAAGALRAHLNKRRKMRADLERGSQHLPTSHD